MVPAGEADTRVNTSDTRQAVIGARREDEPGPSDLGEGGEGGEVEVGAGKADNGMLVHSSKALLSGLCNPQSVPPLGPPLREPALHSETPFPPPSPVPHFPA